MNWLPSCQDGLPFPWSQATGQSKIDPENEMAFTKKHFIEIKWSQGSGKQEYLSILFLNEK